jgi:hypothetical protein
MNNAPEGHTETVDLNQINLIINQRDHEYDRLPDYVIYIERLVELALSTEGVFFNRNRQNEYPPSEGTFLEIMPTLIGSYRPDVSYSLKAGIFYTSCLELGWDESIPADPNTRLENNQCVDDIFNALIDKIRLKGQSRAFKQAELKRVSNADRGFESARRYVNSLFTRYARLCVIRIDLAYSSKTNEAEAPLSRIQKDFKTFIHGWREKSVFKNMVGYIAKLEYGEIKKHHFHVMLFFDGAKSHQDISIGIRVGEYWKSITQPDGIYFNCNANKLKYRFLGIGMVSHDDEDKQYNLASSLKYFFKKGQYLTYKYKEKTRTYFRGEINTNEKSLAGRPRRTKLLIHQSSTE